MKQLSSPSLVSPYSLYWPPVLSSSAPRSFPALSLCKCCFLLFPYGAWGRIPEEFSWNSTWTVYLNFSSSRRTPLLSLAKGGPLPTVTLHHIRYFLHSTLHTQKYVILLVYHPYAHSPTLKHFLLVLYFQFIQVAEHLEIMLLFVEHHEYLISYLISSHTLGKKITLLYE